MKGILVVGELVLDLITIDYDTKLKDARTFNLSYGGSPGNIARNIADMGLKAYLFTRVGNDPFGEEFKRRLSERNVDTSLMQKDYERNTSMVFINKSIGNPDFFPIRGSDFNLEYDEKLDEILEEVSIVHFSSWPISRNPARNTVEKIIKKAKSKDVKIAFDPNYREKLWEVNHDGINYIKNILKDIYLVKPSEDDSFHIFGKMFPHEYILKYHEYGAKYVILTMGRDGALVSDGKNFIKINSMAEKVCDTTGAGDALWSGVYYGILNGYDIFESTLIGSCVSAFKLSSENKEEKIPDIREIYKKFTGKVLK